MGFLILITLVACNREQSQSKSSTTTGNEKVSAQNTEASTEKAATDERHVKGAELPKLVTIGEGGGFSGAVTSFITQRNGTVTRHNTYNNSKVLLHNLELDVLNQLYDDLAELDLPNAKFSYPGNMYKFITMEMEDGTKHSVKWGNPSKMPPAKYMNFYSKYMGIFNTPVEK